MISYRKILLNHSNITVHKANDNYEENVWFYEFVQFVFLARFILLTFTMIKWWLDYEKNSSDIISNFHMYHIKLQYYSPGV